MARPASAMRTKPQNAEFAVAVSKTSFFTDRLKAGPQVAAGWTYVDGNLDIQNVEFGSEAWCSGHFSPIFQPPGARIA
jgi:hypothetical protein